MDIYRRFDIIEVAYGEDFFITDEITPKIYFTLPYRDRVRFF